MYSQRRGIWCLESLITDLIFICLSKNSNTIINLLGVDKEKLFYLKTRGIDEVEAKSFLVNSFIEEISGEITNKKIQDVFKKCLVQSGQL